MDRKNSCRVSLTALLALACVVGCDGTQPPRSLLVLSLDTVRRDHVSAYGYPRPTTPTIDALAREGVLFGNAFAQFSSTVASHTSMFTGLYPHTHRNESGRELLPEHRTLAEILAKAGYRTGAFVSGFTLRGQGKGLGRGFEVYDAEFEGPRRPGDRTLERALSWLESLPGDEPFFLFIHFYDAHGPYLPSPEFSQQLRSAKRGPVLSYVPPYQRQADPHGSPLVHVNDFVDRYDSQIRFQDELLSIALSQIDMSDVVTVILSDHGETLGERRASLNLDHGKTVFEEQIAIPMILHGPGVEASRMESLVETVDLLPTLLPILGVTPLAPVRVQGEDLGARLSGGQLDESQLVFASCHALPEFFDDIGYELRPDSLIHTVRDGRFKLILYPGMATDYVELYDLRSDPMESTDVAKSQPAVRERLLSELEAWLQLGSVDSMAPLNRDEDLEALRALGYVE